MKKSLAGQTDLQQEQELAYIFVSHFESDECGGLSLLLENQPKAKPVCSEITARQLNGFGIANEIAVQKPGGVHTTRDV